MCRGGGHGSFLFSLLLFVLHGSFVLLNLCVKINNWFQHHSYSCFLTIGVVITVVDHCCIIDPCLSLDVNKGKWWYNYYATVLLDTGMHTIALSCSPFSTHKKQFTEWCWNQLLILTHKFNNTKEPWSTNKRREKRKEPCPPPRHIRLYIFLVFLYFRGGRRNRRKKTWGR